MRADGRRARSSRSDTEMITRYYPGGIAQLRAVMVNNIGVKFEYSIVRRFHITNLLILNRVQMSPRRVRFFLNFFETQSISLVRKRHFPFQGQEFCIAVQFLSTFMNVWGTFVPTPIGI